MMIGRMLGHYRIEQRLGAGGMGVVYRALDTRLGRAVAIKVIAEAQAGDETARARLLREARSASSLNHPHICTIHEVGEAEGCAYIVMELVVGRLLSAVAGADGLPADEVLRYGSQIADALAHAHERGIIHRDLKSSNVMITPEGRVKVLDFGLARRVATRSGGAGGAGGAGEASGEPGSDPLSQSPTRTLTSEGTVAGTLAYMPPEALRGEPPDARGDVWALGVVLFEMASGRLPFEGGTPFELSAAILREAPAALPPRAGAGLRGVIQRCLAREPAQRTQRASEVRAALEALQSGEAPPSRVAASTLPPAAWLERLRTVRFSGRLALLAGVALIIVIALVIYSGWWPDFTSGIPEPPVPPGGLPGSHVGNHPGAAAGAAIDSLAVLPLENLSGDPEQEYFADGMTEELIATLAKIRSLRVISRTSVMRYKGARKPLAEIAAELDVDAVVEGTVRRAGNRVRITAQLIDAEADRHLWAESYERDLSDILALQSDVARAIASEVKASLTPQEEVRLRKSRRVDPEAHEAYLKGRDYLNRVTDEDNWKAVAFFKQAIERDPGHASAHAALAMTYFNLYFFGAIPPGDASRLLKLEAVRALELDDTQAEAHSALGLSSLYYDWDWHRAEQELRSAIDLDPGRAQAHWAYGQFLGYLGRFDEALREMSLARSLDPLASFINSDLAWVHLAARNYDQAIDQYRKTLELDPNYLLSRLELGQALSYKGNREESLVELRKALALSDELYYKAAVGAVLGRSGRKEEASRLLSELLASSRVGYVSSPLVASVYVSLDDKVRALEWLEKGYQQRDAAMIGLKVLQDWDPLRSEPQFQKLLRRIGFPPD